MDGVITVCERARRNLIDLDRVKRPIRVIPPLDRLSDVPKTNDRPYNNSSLLRLVSLGRLEPYKGSEALLRLWKEIGIGNAELHLYGPDPGHRFRALAQRLGLRRVFFHGAYEHSELPKLLDKADIGLTLSFAEGHPLAAWEYMACGVPFVITDVGAAPEFTKDNPDALMVACNNRAVKEGIEEMARRVRSGCTSRQRLQSFQQHNFSYDKAAALHLKALLEPGSFWREDAIQG
jgi:glycosyltransferase involved in cell wall biosynthesis